MDLNIALVDGMGGIGYVEWVGSLGPFGLDNVMSAIKQYK